MFNQKIISYGSASLVGAAIATGIILSWQGEKTEALANEQWDQVAEATVHKEGGQHEHHEEDIVKLTEEQIKKLGLKIESAGPGSLELTLSTRGKIIFHPDRLVHIIPKVSGVAREAYKNIGNPVSANELLAELESREMAEIKAGYLAALSKERLASATLMREAKLFQEKVSAGQDYLNAKNLSEESKINVQLYKQKLHAFGLSEEEIENLADESDRDFRLYQMRSPISGSVIFRHITKGEFVESTTTIYEIADLSTVWVDIGIYPKDLPAVKEGQMVEVVLPIENHTAQARLIYVSPIVSDETITAKAVAELDNADGMWRPGVFVKVNISTEQIQRPLVVPKAAVISEKGKNYMFIEIPEGFERRVVKTGISDRQNMEIVSGLKAGEAYVANNTFLLKAELGKSAIEHDD